MPIHGKIITGAIKLAKQIGTNMVEDLVQKGMSKYAARKLVQRQNGTILEKAQSHLRACAHGCLKEVGESMGLKSELKKKSSDSE